MFFAVAKEVILPVKKVWPPLLLFKNVMDTCWPITLAVCTVIVVKHGLAIVVAVPVSPATPCMSAAVWVKLAAAPKFCNGGPAAVKNDADQVVAVREGTNVATTVPESARTHPWTAVKDPFMDEAVPVRCIVTAPCVPSAGRLMV